MNWIMEISNNDNVVKDVVLTDSEIRVIIELWNGGKRQLTFNNYRAIKEKNCIGATIGDIKINTDSDLFSEIKKDILNGDGSMQEIQSVKSFIFMDVWDDEVSLLEIVAEFVEYE